MQRLQQKGVSTRVSDENQIEIAPSFVALYVAPSGKLMASRAELSERYSLCEDLANLVTETAMTQYHQLGITEADVIQRCYQGLLGDNALVSPIEAQWVVCRLAELCNWPQPAPALFGVGSVAL